MPTKPDVKDSDSSTDKQDDSRSSQGNGPSKSSDDRPDINRVMEENRKLKEALEKQGVDIEDMKAEMEDRLAELQAKSNPTGSQQTEMEKLEAGIRAIESKEEAKPWFEKIRRESDNVAAKRIIKLDYDLALEWVEDKAEEVGEDAKKLEREIVARLKDGRWGDRPLRVRVKNAYKEIHSMREKAKKDDEDKKKGIQRSAENNGIPPARTPSGFVDLAKEGKIGNALDDIYKKQIEANRRV